MLINDVVVISLSLFFWLEGTIYLYRYMNIGMWNECDKSGVLRTNLNIDASEITFCQIFYENHSFIQKIHGYLSDDFFFSRSPWYMLFVLTAAYCLLVACNASNQNNSIQFNLSMHVYNKRIRVSIRVHFWTYYINHRHHYYHYLKHMASWKLQTHSK